MINKIDLKFGSKVGEPPLSFTPGSLTIFIGPNNSGKSLALREIEKYCNEWEFKPSHIIEKVEFQYPDDSSLENEIRKHQIPYSQSESIPKNHIRFGKYTSNKGLLQVETSIQNVISWKTHNVAVFHSQYIKMFTARLDGKGRFSLTEDKPLGDLKLPADSPLKALFLDNDKRQYIRNLIYEAFEKYFVADPTHVGTVKINFSDIPPPNENVERSFSKEAIEFHSNCDHIKKLSDGVQAYTGLIMAALMGEDKYILIDEPEAFLHPSLAYLLGKRLAEIMVERDGNLFLSTHNPHFLMGCMQAGKPINLIRLTYQKKQATARILEPKKLSRLFKNPLLRSTGVLESLFYDYVIVAEGDSDRALYNEINERLLSQKPDSGIQNCLFINAQNKQTVWDIVGPLREFGIPAVGIVDIDVIREGGTNFSKVLDGCFIPKGIQNALRTLRANLHSKFKKIDNTCHSMKYEGGINCLVTDDDKGTCKKFFEDLANYGCFVVPNGELQSWLPKLGVSTGNKSDWLVKVFGVMGSDSADSNYLTPGDDDIWQFIYKIKLWLTNDNRDGMP